MGTSSLALYPHVMQGTPPASCTPEKPGPLSSAFSGPKPQGLVGLVRIDVCCGHVFAWLSHIIIKWICQIILRGTQHAPLRQNSYLIANPQKQVFSFQPKILQH